MGAVSFILMDDAISLIVILPSIKINESGMGPEVSLYQ